MSEELTDRERKYVEHLARNLDSRAAAKSAGYSESFLKVAAHRLGKRPAVVQALAAIRAEARRLAVFDVTQAMEEVEKDHAFAVEKGNAMAAVKATELRCKLAGLLIERVEVFSMDMKGAIAEVQKRVINVTSNTAESSAIDLIDENSSRRFLDQQF